jgi:hypothetical protein
MLTLSLYTNDAMLNTHYAVCLRASCLCLLYLQCLKQQLQEAEEDRCKGYTIPPELPGSAWAASSEKVVKSGDKHDTAITASEQAIRLGLFCITLMYFR